MRRDDDTSCEKIMERSTTIRNFETSAEKGPPVSDSGIAVVFISDREKIAVHRASLSVPQMGGQDGTTVS